MTIKRSCSLGVLLVLGLLSGPINSMRVQAVPVYDDMGNIVSQGIQKTGQAINTSTQNVGTVIGQSAQNVGDAFGQGVQAVGQELQQTTQAVGQEIKQRVQAVSQGIQQTTQAVGQEIKQGVQQTTESIAKGIQQTTEAIEKGVQKGAKAVAKVINEGAQTVTDVTTEVVDRGSTVVGGAVDLRTQFLDTQLSVPFDEIQRNLLAVVGASGKGVPPVLKTGKVINIISPKGNVYFDGHKLCVGNVPITDPKTQFYIKRVQAAYMWLQPLSRPGSFVRHVPKGTIGAGADEYLLIAKPADFGYELGGAWERLVIVKGKYIRATRWDGSITELGGYVVLGKDGMTLTTRNAAGNNYAFSEAEALPFIFLEVGSKDAIAYNASMMQLAEYEKKPQLTADQIVSLPPKTIVTIQSDDERFLECPGTEKMKEFGDTSSWATFSASNPYSPTAQFVLQKSGKFVGFQASNGKLLEAVSPELKGQPAWVVRGEGQSLEGAALWTVIQKTNAVCLKNEAVGGCLNNRGGIVRTHGNQTPWAPASTDINTVNVKVRLAFNQKMPVLVEPVAPVQPVEVPVQPVALAADLWTDLGSNIMNLGGVQIIAHPSMAPFNRFVFKSPWSSSDNVVAFIFKAATSGNGFAIILSGEMDQSSGSAVRLFTIGCYNNTAIIVGPDKGGPIIKPAAGMTILDGENVYTRFWITYDKSSGMVAIGKGSIPGSNVLVSSKDPVPLRAPKIYLGVGALFDPKKGSPVFYNSISAVSSVDVQALDGKESEIAKVVQQPVASPSVAVEKVAPAKGVTRVVRKQAARGASRGTKAPKAVAPEVATRAKRVAPTARRQAVRGTSRVEKAPVAVVSEVTAASEGALIKEPEVVESEVAAPVKKVTAPRARVTRGAANTKRSVRATRNSSAAL